MMACIHGYPSVCPICTAIDKSSDGMYLLLADNEWFPADLLTMDLDDDVFWPNDKSNVSETMDWTDLPFILDTVMEPQGNSTSSDKSNSQSSGNEGVIINNFYSNQYQNSIDLSANGGNAGGAPKTEGQLGNILGNAANAFSTMAPLLLDQNTEEMENLSDRVDSDKAGNSAVNTQSSVGRLCGYGMHHKGKHPASCADTATDKVLSAERYYTIDLATWTTTLGTFSHIRIPLPHVLAGEDGGVFGSTLRRHYLCKCGWRIQVQCNASQFHAGSLLVFMAPEFYTGHTPTSGTTEPTTPFTMDSSWQTPQQAPVGFRYDGRNGYFALNHQNYWQWMVYPHQILNLRTNTSVDLEVPFTNIAPTSSWTQHANWTLVVAVLTPLQYAAGSATDVQITASIQPVKPVFNGLRHEAVVPQSPIPVTVREHKGTFYSTNPDTTVPIYGKTIATPSDYMCGEFSDLVELCKLPTFLGNPANTSPPGGRYPYFSATNSVPTTALASYQVALSCSGMSNSMLAAVARNFNQYRGSLNFLFVFTGTAMTKGKFLIAYTPPGAGKPTTREQAMQATYAIWDLGLNSSYNFTVPFISPTHYRQTSYTSTSITSVDGWLTVWQLTPLTYPANTPPNADILTLVSAGDDFTLRMPISPTKWNPQGVDNAEKGKVSNDDATVDFVAEPVKFPDNQTKVSFFYDRSVPLGLLRPAQGAEQDFVYAANDSRANSILLTPLPSYAPDSTSGPTETQAPVQWRWLRGTSDGSTTFPLMTKQDYAFLLFSPFTYYKADLEVTLSATSNSNVATVVRWAPTGAPADIGRQLSGYTPSIGDTRDPHMWLVGAGNSQTSFVVPYNSPLSVLPAAWFNGWSDFGNTKDFGVAPNADFGRLWIQGNTAVAVRIRYKKMKVFCPRPTLFFPWPSATTTRIHADTPVSVMELQNPFSFYRVDLFITFTDELITFDYKVHGRSVFQYQVPGLGLTCAGRMLVCMGQMPNHAPFSTVRHLYHVVFTGSRNSFGVVIYLKRHRPWKKPLHEELHDYGFECFSDFFKHVREYHAAYYKQRLMHDVETNPGPPVQSVFRPQGGVLTKSQAPMSGIQNLLLRALGIDADHGEFTRAVTMITDLCNTWEKAKNTLVSPEFWTVLIMKTVKFIAASVLYLHNPDLTATICLSLMTGVDVLTNESIFNWLSNKLSKLFHTPPPPASPLLQAQSPLREANDGFNLAKNIEWAIKTVQKIVDWLMSWFKQEETHPQAKLDKMLADFPEHCASILAMRNGRKAYTDCAGAFKYFEDLYNLAVQCKRIPLATLCEKFKNKHDHAVARPEPVVVVLRGDAGQGKSVTSQIIAQAVSKLAFGRQSVYSIPPDSDYLDGYENQFSVIMDDLGQNPDGEDFKVFCQMVSSTNFLPNMAHLEKKGTPFTSNFIVATTNLPKFRPVTVAHYPAVDRRITFDLTVEAGPACKTPTGMLDVEKAFQEIPGEPQLDCFSSDCALLHKRGVQFICNRTRKIYNLQQIVKMVKDTIDNKVANLKKMNTLVAQSPNNGNDMEHIITCLRQNNAALQDQIDELQEAFAQAQERQNFLSDWMKVSAIIFAGIASLSAVCKLVGRLKNLIWPSPVRVELSEGEQAAYAGAKRGAKQALQVLDLQGGGRIIAQAGNPVMDYEVCVAKNMVAPITFYYADKAQVTQSCLLVKGHLLVVNRHVAETDWVSFELRDVRHERDTVTLRSVNRSGMEVDLTFIKVTKGPLFKDNTKKFCSNKDDFPQKNETVTGIMNTGLPFVFNGKFIIGNHPVNTTTGATFNHCLHYRANTRRGWCGSAVICQVNGKKAVYGMHSAGGGGLAAATIITQELVEAAEQNMDRLVPQGAIMEIGTGSVVHVPRKTKLRRTVAHEIFLPKFEPAVLSRYDPRTEKDVDQVAFSKHTTNMEELPAIFNMVAKEYANRVFTKLGKENQLLTTQQAILGLPGMDPMEKDTSPGLPYTQQGLRRTDLVNFETGKMDHNLDYAHSKLMLGHYEDVVYQSFLKDEIRPIEKIHEAKTRIVDVPPFHHCIWGRQLLGRFASRFQTNPGLDLGSAIGTDPDVDWTVFAHQLAEFKYVYDVDYSNFDASHSTAIFEILIQEFFTPQNGFDPRIGEYLRSLAVSRHAYEDRRVLIRGGLPSGCAATSMINTIINNIVIRAALYMTYANFEFDDIKVLSYGDDLLIATNYEINFNLVKERLAPFNYKITPANKTSTFPQTSHLQDVVFLKRRFVQFNSFLFRPQMETENLKAMVSYCRPGVLKEKLMSIALLAVHSGPDVYDEIFMPFRRIGVVVPEYSTMLYRWLNLFR
ncbi:polyprotein [Rat theilovirus 1]|uniref:Genome polyprotein n=1 Tax=Rat theilovirus 1 TaxID=529419 RepID=B5SXL8_9PICO|nr:polyprotein [Rat theilovirus 1]